MCGVLTIARLRYYCYSVVVNISNEIIWSVWHVCWNNLFFLILKDDLCRYEQLCYFYDSQSTFSVKLTVFFGGAIWALCGAHPIDIILYWPTSGYLEVVFQNVLGSEHWKQYWYYFNHTEEVFSDVGNRSFVSENS